MAKSDLIAGLDIGSGKITAVSAYTEQETGKLQVVSGISVPCSGLKNGIVTDIKQVSIAVSNVINTLEEQSQQPLSALYIALRGEHLKSEVGHGTYNISRGSDKEITAEDIERVISNAQSISIKSDHEIVSVIPQGFSIDRQRGITNPEGMDGSSLEVDVYITTGLSSALSNLRKSINKMGYRIDGSFYGLMCLCENVLLKEEKELGAVLIDLGGETTSIGICVDGVLQYSKEFDFGCDLITGDIASALHTSKKDAARIKKESGLCFPKYSDEDNDEEIKVPSLDGRTTNSFKKSILLDVIQPRMQDIFEMVRESIIESELSDFISVAILTGGGSSMPGIESLAAQVLGVKEIRCSGVSRDLVEAEDKFFDPLYTTALSLLLYISKRDVLEQKKETEISSKSPILRWSKNIFKKVLNSEIFGG